MPICRSGAAFQTPMVSGLEETKAVAPSRQWIVRLRDSVARWPPTLVLSENHIRTY